MSNTPQNKSLYLPITENDKKWGIVCTTAGYQFVPPHTQYPIGAHPDLYNSIKKGRTLDEYQMVYITKGSGTFRSTHCKRTKISAGTVILLFPGEWHTYEPNPETGWDEFWVGFQGANITRRVEEGFFTPHKPIFNIGYSAGIESCYQEIIREAESEHTGFQVLLSSIVLHILGSIVFKVNNLQYGNAHLVDKIKEARSIMRNNLSSNPSSEEIADQLNLGYTWFRRAFKEYVGISPNQYQLLLKFNRAKELLTTTSDNISEIAYQLGFENVSQFSSFFSKREGISARDYRQKHNP